VTGPSERTPNAGPGGPTIPGRLARLEAERIADRGQQVQAQTALSHVDTRLRRIEGVLEKLTAMVEHLGRAVDRGDPQLAGQVDSLVVMVGMIARQLAVDPGVPDTKVQGGRAGEDPAR
jgi:hypothetical protein